MRYIYAAFLFLTCGCMTTEKATTYLTKRGELSAICAERFPVKEFTTVKIETKYDTILQPGRVITITDTVPCPDGSKVPVSYTKPCPPDHVITKTVTKDSIVTIEKTDKVDACLKQAEKLRSTILTQGNEINRLNRLKWWLAVGGFVLALGMGVFLKLYFKI
jgi:hypothetical protein